jgi:hypothetical protein
MAEKKTRVDFNAPKSLVKRADSVVDILNISRSRLLIDVLEDKLVVEQRLEHRREALVLFNQVRKLVKDDDRILVAQISEAPPMRTDIFDTKNRVGRSFDELFHLELPRLLSCLIEDRVLSSFKHFRDESRLSHPPPPVHDSEISGL